MTREQFIEHKIKQTQDHIAYWEKELKTAQEEKLAMDYGCSQLDFNVIDSRIRHAGQCIDDLEEIDLQPLLKGRLPSVSEGAPSYIVGDTIIYDFFWAGYLDALGNTSAEFDNTDDVPVGGVVKDLSNGMFLVKIPEGHVRPYVFKNPEIV
jgi:hypothetical protein